MPESKARTAQVHTPSGWENKSVSQLQPGDRFRLVAPCGTVVPCSEGKTEHVAGAKVTQLKPVTTELRARVRARFEGFFATRPVACA